MPADTSADVLVVGAGLAGLACAVTLHQAGVGVEVIEAEPEVGGRVRSRTIDGFVIDRGFQLLNPAYPAVPEFLDVPALHLQRFPAGVAVATGGRRLRLLDPRRAPLSVPASAAAVAALVAQDGPQVLAELAAFGGYAVAAGYGDPDDLKHRPDISAADAFHHAGITGTVLERIVRPFLAGVLGEGELATSRRFVDLVLRSFLRGTPAVPARGMGEISRQLAGRLPDGAVRLGTPYDLTRLPNDAASSPAARGLPAVVVDATAGVGVGAESGSGAAGTAGSSPGGHGPGGHGPGGHGPGGHGPGGHGPGGHGPGGRGPGATGQPSPPSVPGWHALTTHWFAVDSRSNPRPAPDGILHVDGDHRGPVVNTAVQSLAAPSYAPPGYWLVQATVLGATPMPEETLRHCEQIYGVPTQGWELLDISVVPQALPVATPPLPLRRPVRRGERLFACGDSYDTPSIQGALVSGRRTAHAVLAALGARPTTSSASAKEHRAR